MAVYPIKTLRDLALSAPDGVEWDIQGRVTLARENRLRPEGDPRDIPVGVPEAPTGILFYGGETRQTVVEQFFDPLPVNRHLLNWEEFDPTGDPHSVDNEDLPEGPAVRFRDISALVAGYKQGAVLLYWTEGIDGKHTLPSPDAAITVADDGDVIAGELPQNTSGRSNQIGLWASRDGGANKWHQATIDISRGIPETFRLKGPFAQKLRAPTTNQTNLGAPAEPVVRRDAAPYNLLPSDSPVAGVDDAYRVWVSTATAEGGESLARVNARHIPIGSEQQNAALWVSEREREARGVGIFVYVRQRDGRTYRVHHADQSPDAPHDYGGAVPVYSYDPTTWGHTDMRVTQRDLPIVDTSGIPAPQDPLDGPPALDSLSAGGLHESGTKTWHGCAAYVIAGEVGPRGPMASATIAANRSIEVVLPKRVNKVINSEYSELDYTGLPLYHSYRNFTSPDLPTAEGGRLRLPVNRAAGQAGGEHAIAAVAVEKSKKAVVSGSLAAENHPTTGTFVGTVEAVVQQFATASPIFGTTAPITGSEIPLASLSAPGERRYRLEFDANDPRWHASAVSAWIIHRFTPSTGARALVAYATKPRIQFGSRATPRARRKDKEENEVGRGERRRRAETDVGPEVPDPDTADYVAGLPPRMPAPPFGEAWPAEPRPEYTAQPPTETTDFSAGLNGWAPEASAGGSAALSGGALSASQPVAGTQGHARVRKELWPALSHAGALGARITLGALPPAGQYETLLAIDDAAGGHLVAVRRYGDGRLMLHSRESSGADRLSYFMGGAAAGAVLNLEVQVTGAGSDERDPDRDGVDGVATVLASIGAGAPLVRRYRHVALAWPDSYPRQGVAGIVAQSAAFASSATVDDLRAYPYGSAYYSEHDDGGVALVQGHFFYPEGSTVRQDRGVQEILVPVAEGQSWSLGVELFTRDLAGAVHPFATEWRMEDGGSEPGPSLTGALSGDNAWQDYRKEGGSALVVPPGAVLLAIRTRDQGAGEWAYQNLAMTPGIVLKRTGRAAASGTYSPTFDTFTPRNHPIEVRVGRTWRRVRLDAETPPGTSVTAAYRSASQNGPGMFLPAGGSPTLAGVPYRRYLEVALTLTGDGVARPSVPLGSPALVQLLHWPVLLREDGSEFDGGAWVGDMPGVYDDPVVEFRERLDRRISRAPIAGDRPALDAFPVVTTCDSAVAEIRKAADKGLLVVEDPLLAVSVTIRTREKVGEPKKLTPPRAWQGRRYYRAELAIPASDVVSVAAVD